MKILKYLGIFLISGLLIASCENGEDAESAAKLKEAGELHDAALALGKDVSQMLEESDDLVASLEEVIPTLDDEMAQEEAKAHITSIAEAKQQYDAWQKSIVEVPGHAHAHHEGDGHHHHHHDHSMDDASPDEILSKQETIKEFVADIKNRLTKATEMAQTVIDDNE